MAFGCIQCITSNLTFRLTNGISIGGEDSRRNRTAPGIMKHFRIPQQRIKEMVSEQWMKGDDIGHS